jgi:hypothetical protein
MVLSMWASHDAGYPLHQPEKDVTGTICHRDRPKLPSLAIVKRPFHTEDVRTARAGAPDLRYWLIHIKSSGDSRGVWSIRLWCCIKLEVNALTSLGRVCGSDNRLSNFYELIGHLIHVI